LVVSMDEQFGITGTFGDGVRRSPEASVHSPASSVGRSGGRSRPDRRRADGGADGQAPVGEQCRDRSPRLGNGRDGSETTGDR
jgi:hypothetical protein